MEKLYRKNQRQIDHQSIKENKFKNSQKNTVDDGKIQSSVINNQLLVEKVEPIIKNLRNKGYRNSRLKRKVIEYIFLSDQPVSVGEIVNKLEKDGISYFKSSLYRAIEILLSEKIILEIDLLDGKKRYEANNYVHHHHAMCTVCGSVICVEIPNKLEEVEDKLFDKKGFKVTSHVLEFFGVCEKCTSKQKDF